MEIYTYTLGACMANCYIVRNADGHAVLIDPCDEGGRLARILEARSLTLDAVLLTHGHIDHIAGLDELLDAVGNVRVFLHKAEAPYLCDPALNLSEMITGTPYAFGGAVRTLSDGEEISLCGLSFRVLHTPGHTDGSVCYLCGDALFSGDTLFGGTVGRTDFPHGDMDKLMDSLKKLTALPDETRVYPGHMGSTTIGREKRYNPYLAE